jgi:uncharacterized protein YjdB
MWRIIIAGLIAVMGLLGPYHQRPALALRLERIVVTPPDRRLPLGQTASMTAVGVFDNNTTDEITDEVEWSSSDSRIVSISNANDTRGHVTAHTSGVAFISARLEGISSTETDDDARVRVKPDLVAIRISPKESQLPVDFSRSLDAEGIFSDGTIEDISNVVDWVSNEPNVVQVSNEDGRKGEILALQRGTARITASDPETRLSSRDTDADAVIAVLGRVKSIAISPGVEELPIPGERRFSATALLDDGDTFPLPRSSMEWSSSDPRVATVSNTSTTAGLVTAVGVGTAMLSAVHRQTGIASDSEARIRVIGRLLSLDITPLDRSVDVNETKSMTATGQFEDGEIRDISDEVFWISSNPAFLQVRNDARNRGKVTGIHSGVAFIDAQAFNGLTATARARVRVFAALVAIRIEPSLVTVPQGFTAALDAVGTFSDGTQDDVSGKVLWSAADPSIIEPSTLPGSLGDISAVAPGTSSVSVVDPETGTSSNASGGDATVTVAGEIAEFVVRPDEKRLFVGDTHRFTVRAVLTDASVFPLSRRSVLWSTGDLTIATVSNDPSTAGVVSAVSIGEVIVSALHPGSGMVATPAILDVKADLSRIEIRPADRRITLGESRSMTALGHFADGTTEEITDDVQWSSSNASVAVVSNESGSRGHVTGLQPGNVAISAAVLSGLSSTSAGLDAHVTVVGQLVSIRILPTENRVAVGFAAVPLDAEGTFGDGTVANVSTRVVWASSAPLVVSVSNEPGNHGQLTPLAPGVAVVSASTPNSSVTSTGTGGDATVIVGGRVTGISIRPLRDNLPIGNTRRFSLRALLDDGSSFEVAQQTVDWRSNHPEIATVSNDLRTAGLVTARSIGEAVISATHLSSGIRSSTGGDATVTVPGRIVGLEIRPVAQGLFVGGTAEFDAIAILDNDRILRLSRGIEFTSGDPIIATLENGSGERGTVTGKSPGSAPISVKHLQSGISSSPTGGDATAVVFAAPESLRVRAPGQSIRAGTRTRLQALARPVDLPIDSDGPTAVEVTDAVEWTSSNPDVIRIENGEALAVSKGTATISARHLNSGLTSTITGGDVIIRVVANIERLKLKPGRLRTRVGAVETRVVKTIAIYSDGARVDITRNVEFRVEDTAIAEVGADGENKGRILAKSSGQTTVTAVEPITGVSSRRPGRIVVKPTR